MIRHRLKYIVFILGALLLVPVGRSMMEKAKSAKETKDTKISVRVEKVRLQDIARTLEYIGNVKAEAEVMVYPKVSGKIIEKIKEDGSAVDKGDIIAYIDRDETGLKFEKAPVESPIKGTVGRVFVDIGSQVTAQTLAGAQTAVAMIVDMDTMKIDLDIPEIYLPRVSLGQQAAISFDAYPGEIFTGVLTKISPVLNLLNRAAPVEIQIDNKDHRLKSGMFARVIIVIEEHKQVPVVIKEALIGKDPELYVYVAENEKALLKKVTVGIRSGENVEITSGLTEGDLVVVMGQQRLYDNAPVRVEMDEPEGAAR